MRTTLWRGVLVVGLWSSAAAADSTRDASVQLELGVNTRRFEAADRSQVAFRGSTDPEQATGPEGTALTTSIRFTANTRYNTFLGVEGETGKLVGDSDSNIAGGYGVVGARGDAGPLRIAAELVAGRRWVRYDSKFKTDPSVMIAEPRVRADLWLTSKLMLGAAVGATLSERTVWMAGLYLGIHSFSYDR